MLRFVLFRLVVHTVLSGAVAIVLGSVLGGLIGTIRRRIKETLYVSTLSAFLGCLIASTIPPISHIGSLESWGTGGFGGLQAMIMFILIALGGFVGSLLVSLFLFKPFLRIKSKGLLTIFIGVYTLMAFFLYYGYSRYCFPTPAFSYC